MTVVPPHSKRLLTVSVLMPGRYSSHVAPCQASRQVCMAFFCMFDLCIVCTTARDATQVLQTADPKQKAVLTHQAWQHFSTNLLQVGSADAPARPARPDKPEVCNRQNRCQHQYLPSDRASACKPLTNAKCQHGPSIMLCIQVLAGLAVHGYACHIHTALSKPD